MLILNFKTYLKNIEDHLELIKKLKNIRKELWLALNPYFYLILAKKLKGLFKIGLQNIAPILEKPQTGETVYEFELINLADFVLLGHSERYRLGENLEIVKFKIKSLQDKKIKLFIFFSENSYKPVVKFDKIKNKLAKNLTELLSVVKKTNYQKIYLVYEPWWAISTEKGKIPEKNFLRNFLIWYNNFLENKYKTKIPILYGGSFNSKLAEAYKGLNFDGYVLGKVSVNPKEIKKIINILS